MSEATYRDRLRSDVLDLAMRVVEAEGLDGLQARRIAREAGCSVGSIYNVFGDIDGLIAAVNTRSLARMRAALETAAAAAPGAPALPGEPGAGLGADQAGMPARLLALAHAYARFALDNVRAWEAIFKHRRPDGTAPPQEHLAEQARLLALIERAIAPLGAEPGAQARSARALFGAVHGIVTLAVDDRLAGTVRSELDAQIELIVSIIVCGLEQALTRAAPMS